MDTNTVVCNCLVSEEMLGVLSVKVLLLLVWSCSQLNPFCRYMGRREYWGYSIMSYTFCYLQSSSGP